jgi:hypothetical protein
MAIKMISAGKQPNDFVEFTIDTDEVAGVLPSTLSYTDIILKSGHVMNVKVGYSDLVYLLFNK